jgi:SAM-dependent methyltransferase
LTLTAQPGPFGRIARVTSAPGSHHSHQHSDVGDDARQRWLAAQWSLISTALPRPPARLLEIGCGAAGGIVPAALTAGYEAVGVDPQAPDAPMYRRVPFEEFEPRSAFDAVVSVQALHHLPDLRQAFERVDSMLADDAVLVIVEWAWERIDERTARWLFGQLPADGGIGWAGERRASWQASGQPWDQYRDEWARGHGLHTWHAVETALQTRFAAVSQAAVPSLFGDVAEISESAERAAIDAGQIAATGVHWIGRRRRGGSVR